MSFRENKVSSRDEAVTKGEEASVSSGSSGPAPESPKDHLPADRSTLATPKNSGSAAERSDPSTTRMKQIGDLKLQSYHPKSTFEVGNIFHYHDFFFSFSLDFLVDLRQRD
jgi:hypothetical protein